MSPEFRQHALFALIPLLLLAAAATLIPTASTTRINDLGYVSICPFAPWSALALIGAAGVVWMIRDYLKSQQ